MLDKRRRRWANIKHTMKQIFVFAGIFENQVIKVGWPVPP